MKKFSCLAVSIIDRFDGAAERSGRSHSEPQTGGDLYKTFSKQNLTPLQKDCWLVKGLKKGS
jgi:hypothetical protein